MKNSNYITIQGWMVNELHLSGNELILYALIYGFSQDGETEYYGSQSYMAESLGISRESILRTIKKLEEKGLVREMPNKELFKEKLRYKAIHSCNEMPQHDVTKSHNSCDKKSHDNIEDNNSDNKEDTKKDELFEECWKLYQRKGSKAESKKEWAKLKDEEKLKVKEHIPYYVSSQSEKVYQKDFQRYLKHKIFNNVVYKGNATLFDPEQMNEVGEYRPKMDGFNLRWLESEKCYMTTFDFSMLNDGYTDENRPSSAVVMYNGWKYKWNVESKKWERL